MTEKSNQRRSARNQYYAVICMNLMTAAYGACCVWTSPSLPLLESPDSPLSSGPVSIDESSWISSILCIGGVIGTYAYGWITNRFGRKIPLLSIALPSIISLILILFGTKVSYLMVSRFLLGLAGGGVYLIIPQYTVEIAEDRIRGALGSLVNFFRNIGYLLGYILGHFLSYENLPWALMVFPILFFCSVAFLPEAPIVLIKKNEIGCSEKALRFYRGYNPTETVKGEFTKEFAKLENDMLNEKNSNQDKLQIQDFTTKVAKKSIFIGVCLIAFREFSGLFAMLTYSSTIFIEAGSSLSPNLSSIAIGFMQLVGSYVSTLLVDRAGRKILIVFSSLGLCVALGAMSVFIYLKNSSYDVSEVKWIPLVCFSTAIFIGNIGAASLPYVVIAEIVPVKIKNCTLTVLWSFSFFLSFVSVKSVSFIVFYFGMHGLFLFYSLTALVGAIFVIIVMPETKGKSLEAIAELLDR